MAGMNRTFGYAQDRVAATTLTPAQLILAPGATVDVYETGTQNHVALYTDAAGTTPLANPFTADLVSGFYDFYCQPQRIDVRYSGTGITTPYTLGDVLYQQTAPANLINIKTFGAVGNGVTSDQAAFQAALDAINAAGVSTTLQIPDGIYRLTDELTYIDGPPLRIIGDSREGAQLVWDDNATRGLTLDATTASVSSLLTSDGQIGDRTVNVANGALFNIGNWVFLDDSQTNGGTLVTRVHSIVGNAVTLEDALPCQLLVASGATLLGNIAHPLVTGIEVRNLTFACATTAPSAKLTLLLVSRCAWFTVENCHFNGSTGPLITTRQTYNGVIRECIFENAITIAGSAIENQTATGLLITGCRASVCQFGYTFSSSPYCRLIGNRMSGRATSVALGRGVRFGVSSNFGICANNTLSDMNLYGIYSQDSAFLAITGNTISFAGWTNVAAEHGIQLGGFEADFCHHCTITGNVIRNATGYGIAIAPTTTPGVTLYSVITGNIISGCVQGGIQLFRVRYNTVVGNTISAPGSTTVEGIIDVRSTDAGYNIIADNVIANEDSTSVVAIFTNNGNGDYGHNVISGNILDQTLGALTLNLAAGSHADTFGLPQPLPADTLTPALSTDIETPANLLETTFYSKTYPAGTFAENQTQGMLFYANLILTGTFTKAIRFYIGNATPALIQTTDGTCNIDVVIHAFAKPSGNHGFVYKMSIYVGAYGGKADGRVLTTTSAASFDNPATTPVEFKLTAQNVDDATAGQVALSFCGLWPLGVPAGAYLQP
jgi:parallel beta-helix repeat protein